MLVMMDVPGLYVETAQEKASTLSSLTGGWFGGGLPFQTVVMKALLQLMSKAKGKKLVTTVSELLLVHGKTIVIEEASDATGQGGSGWDATGYVIRWSPKEIPPTSDDFDDLNNIPAFIILGHELVHALHTLTDSTQYMENDARSNIAIEEARTIGLGPWENGNEVNENALRGEWNLKLRRSFQGAVANKLLIGTPYLNKK